MPVIQQKATEKVFAREPQRYVPASRLTNVARTRSHPELAHRVAAGGSDLHLRDLRVGSRLAVRLVLAHRTLAFLCAALSADDSGGLRNSGRISADREPQPARTPEPHLVHRVVQRGARRHYGRAGVGEP